MPFLSRTLELLLLIFTTYWLDLKGECSTPMVSINFAVFAQCSLKACDDLLHPQSLLWTQTVMLRQSMDSTNILGRRDCQFVSLSFL